MKFGENMHMVVQLSDPEWAPFWVNYVMIKVRLQRYLYSLVDSTNVVHGSFLQCSYAN